MNKSRSLLQLDIISSYLFAETLINFGICALVFTLTAFMSQILTLTELVLNKGLGLQDTVILIIYFLPSLLYLVMPLSLLMGILITLGRMSSDGEVLAFKASGISLGQLFRPVFLVVLLAYVATTFLTVYLSPRAAYALKRHIYDIARSKAEMGLKERIFNTDFNDIMIYVNEIEPKTNRLRGVLISDTHRVEEPATIIAEEGYFVSEPEKLALSLHLKNGSIHSLNRASNTYRKVDFGAYSLSLDLQAANQSTRKNLKKQEISTGELAAVAAEVQPEGEHYPLMVEFHSRFAIPFACIVFGLLGVPLGVYSPRTGRSYGFVVGLVVIIFYYILFSFGRNIGSTGVVPPSVAIWLPNGLFLILALYLYRKGAAEASIPLLEHLARLTDIVRQKVRFLVEGTKPLDPATLGIMEDLNIDSEHVLVLKLGIDHTLAKNIIRYRQSRGRIEDFEELRNVPGMDDTVFHKIKQNIIG